MGAWETRDIIDGDMLQHCLNCPYPDCIECSLSKGTTSRGRFSEVELELLKNKAYTNKQLADMLGRTVPSIQSKRWEMRVGKCKEEHTSKHCWTEADDFVILHNMPVDCVDIIEKPLRVIQGRRSYLLKKVKENAM